MIKAAHTPGPWNITNVGLNDYGCYRHQIGTHEKTVAYTWSPDEHNSQENEANAILIAAAPALLEALDYMELRCHYLRLVIEEFGGVDGQALCALDGLMLSSENAREVIAAARAK